MDIEQTIPQDDTADMEDDGLLSAEIRSLRALIRRVEKTAEGEQKLDVLLNVLEMHGRACTRLAGMLKAERSLGEGDNLDAALKEAIAIVKGELRGKKQDG